MPHNPVEVKKGIVVYRATDYLHLKALGKRYGSRPTNPLLSARYAGWAIIWKHSNIMKDTDITIFRDCTNECGVCWPLPQPPLLVLWQSLDAGVGRCLVHKSSLVCVSEGNLPMGSISCVWQLLYKGELVSQPPNHLLTRNSKFVVRKC